MNKDAAMHAFFQQFSIPGHEETLIPQDASLPYLTYTQVSGGWGDGENAITVNLYYYESGNSAINEKAREIEDVIGLSGVLIQTDRGAIWIKKGSPFCQAVPDPTDNMIRRRRISLVADFLTTY